MPYFAIYEDKFPSPCIGYVKCKEIGSDFLDKIRDKIRLLWNPILGVEEDDDGFYSKNTEKFYIKLKKEAKQ